MEHVVSELERRGFFKQCTDRERLESLFAGEKVFLYAGFDPTASSLHAGHMIPLFAMVHLSRAGHQPIALIGGGTARIGDPSGKTEMRKMLTVDKINRNAVSIRRQIESFFEKEGVEAIVVDNAEWLAQLNYIEFLRDIGRHFSVNRMLSFETYKMRLETGLSFIEFNYQLLQSYDFLELNRRYGCKLQIGGDDQWGNIVAGTDLIRRVEGKEAFGLTFPLVTRADGKKMGKTEKGALFLDPEMISPYDFFQYWRNVPDADVKKFLLLYTFLPCEHIEDLTEAENRDINKAKETLAFELTKSVHGKEEAEKALDAARAIFSSSGKDISSIPAVTIQLQPDGISVVDLFAATELCSSKSEARRLVKQGGASVNDSKISDPDTIITAKHFESGELLLRAGKKRYYRVLIA